MNTTRIPFFALLAAACALGAWRAAADDVRWELAIPPPPLPVDSTSNAWQTASFESLYPYAGGFASESFGEDQPASQEKSHQQVAYRLEGATWGSPVSELRADFNLGEYLAASAFPAGTIDWVKTREAITNSDAYRQGYVYYVDSATNVERHILFTRGGTVEIPWVLRGNSAPVPQAYTIGHTSMARPFRIFWTSDPFKGPPVDLSAHPHVRLLGDPDIVKATWETNALTAVNGQSNLVRGVFFDSNTSTLQCNAKAIDAEHDEYDGPEGQFVLAYYDTGERQNLLATVVVEAARPKVNVIHAEVGDELRPTGGGYDIEGLAAQISKGDAKVTGDDASPHLYQHTGRSNWSPKNGAVFAISPTDGSTSGADTSEEWKAAVYWKEPDCMDVLWPFEEDCYVISWPAEPVYFAISGDTAHPGLPLFAPTNYTTSLCDWQDPPAIATADQQGCVSATKEGWFTLKIAAEDNIWFQPVRAFLRTNPKIAMTNAAAWDIGRELELLGGAAARNTADAAEQADATLPGYIFQAASTGRKNWNPRLYHEPKQASASDELTAGSDPDADPYESLVSAIYPVNTSTSPIEVWWSQSIRQDGMEGAIRIPCVVQRYAAEWPAADDVPTIVIASQKGSDGDLPTPTGGALYLASTNDMARVEGFDSGFSSGITFGYWINLQPKEAGRPALHAGNTVWFYSPEADGGFSFGCNTGFTRAKWIHIAYVIDPAPTNGGPRLGHMHYDGKRVRTDTLSKTNQAFLLDAANRLAISFGACPKAPGSGSSGIAYDDLRVWGAALTPDEIAEVIQHPEGGASADRHLIARFDFDGENDLVPIPHTTTRYAHDSAPHGSRKLVSDGPLKMTPGAPEPASGIIRSDEGVPAEIYCENDPSMSGYNPNDEHAILLETPGGWAAYALRCDLASEEGSQPLVLVQYAQDGKGAMRPFGIALTNAAYPSLESSRTAGLMFTPPHPLDTLDSADNEKTYAITVPETKTNSFGDVTADTEVVYRDHFNRLWARRDGEVNAYYYYATRPDFWFPGLETQPAAGTLVPWLARVANATNDVLSAAPYPWRWTVNWPTNDVPVLHVAQTLTTAENGLPEVWNALSMAVIFPAPVSTNTMTNEAVVHLIDPTVAQSQGLAVSNSFPDEYGFTLGSSGTTHLKKGKYYFTGLPPSIADRLYVDAANQKMVLTGQYVEKAAGGSYLQLNVLTPEERAGLLGICKMPTNTVAWSNWNKAVNALATAEVQPNKTSRGAYAIPDTGGTTTAKNIQTAYSPVDHYALVASGEGSGYVLLIENDNPDTKVVPEGSPVSVHVLRVDKNLYAGGLTVITDPMNKLSEQLTIAYTEPFGAAADQFEFEWRRTETTASGDVPTDYGDYRKYAGKNGLVSILLGANGADLKDLQNMYYAMRYHAVDGSTPAKVVGTNWSAWCGPTLAEGWVQRVLNSVTPFAQRCSDFSEYTSDIAYSMMEQIGPPWQGDVALNDDNLNNVGLLELYRTVLNRAESMSLALGAKTDAGVDKQLLLAASRIAELYGLLGDEAYSDAKNPTVGSRDFSPSVFCFQNQLPTLLDEELALLRGRTTAVAPAVTNYPYPYYNRLVWNFTKGVTEGEVAYVNNYGIRGSDGEITVEQAAAQYPQGHGDAYGHYLSMVKSFYHLARNPYFDWYASMTEMLLGDSVANVDYFDEEKFAEAAGKLARTAADTMDMTARKAWNEAGGVNGAGYFDADAAQAFGYGEWATRGGYGALCNWAAVNALLPTNGTPANAVFEDRGVKRIDRSTASSLAYLPETVRAIEQRLHALDSGMNPLGLSDNAVPFDFDPSQIDKVAPVPPFEQMLERTGKALGNARAVLEHANEFGSRLAAIAAAEGDAEDGHETVEASYKKDLIAIYGTPLEGDIGPGKTYAQGYDGPDLFHYNYIDLGPYGLEALDTDLSTQIWEFRLNTNSLPVRPEDMGFRSNEVKKVDVPYVTNVVTTTNGTRYTNEVTRTNKVKVTNDFVITNFYTLTPDGIPQARSGMGVRRSEGALQEAYRDFLAAYVKMKQAGAAYGKSVKRLEIQSGIAKAKLRMAATDLAFDEAGNLLTIESAAMDLVTGRTIEALQLIRSKAGAAAALAYESTPKIIGAGLTVNTDPSAIISATVGGVALNLGLAWDGSIYALKTLKAGNDFWVKTIETALKGVRDGFDYYDAQVESWERLMEAYDETVKAVDDLRNIYAELAAAEQAYRAKIAEGDALLEELAMVRKHWANEATAIRYEDMYARIQRNDALAKYTAAFDTAQRYVYLLAKVYDYETGLLSTDPLAGDGFMRSVVAARSLGESGIVSAKAGTLWDAVTRMSANWDVLKGRLGINNPEKATTWFSLRYSLFRIKPGAEGDKAWRDALTACWRDDLWSDPEIARYCQPPESDTAPVAAEPGLVIAFPTAINLAENFFGKPLLGGEAAYSSSDWAVRVFSAGIRFKGYDALETQTADGLASSPNVYLVPVGRDCMRAPLGTSRQTLAFKVLDQVLPVPYETGDMAGLLADPSWVSTLSGGGDGVTIRRHSTMPANGEGTTSTRLVGRSVWNDRWLLVIPASSLSSDRANALKTFIHGLDADKDGMIDIPGVSDIELGFRTFSRSGN